MAEIDVTFHADGLRALATGSAMRQYLDAVAFTITAHAIPHSGVDTGRLVNSMSHGLHTEGDTLVVRLGSGEGDGVQPVWYAPVNWAGDRAAPKPATAEIPRKRPRNHQPRPTPTKPYVRALRELGITFQVAPGGRET